MTATNSLKTELSRLRFLTCGSVDDGKSTLIGRLLHDCGQIPEDVISAACRQSPAGATGPGGLDFAYLLDGLEAERKLGITIDVSYRSFVTPTRAFQVADCPGHAEYTRNMATAASNCDVAIILVDARKGILEQTRRHATICAMLGIKDIALAINKMDLLAWSQETFDIIAQQFEPLSKRLNFASVTIIPTSATNGINLATRLGGPQWYKGPTLLDWLETIQTNKGQASHQLRLPISWVARPDQDTRLYYGTVASGQLALDETLRVGRSGQVAQVKRLFVSGSVASSATSGDAVALELGDHIDLDRGDILVASDQKPNFTTHFVADLIWFDPIPMTPNRKFAIRSASGWVSGQVLRLKYKVNLESGHEVAAHILEQNDIGLCDFATSQPLLCDPYTDHPATGGFIVVDEVSNETLGAGMMRHALRRSANITPVSAAIEPTTRTLRYGHKPFVIWFTGLSGSGKSTIAKLTETILWNEGISTAMLDGDNVRSGLCRDLGFTDTDRVENIRRIAEAAKLLNQAGMVVVCALISPLQKDRDMARTIIGAENFLEVFVDTSLETCIKRDPKGLYKKAIAGEIPNFTGIGSPYEAPLNAGLTLQTNNSAAEGLAALVATHTLQSIKI